MNPDRRFRALIESFWEGVSIIGRDGQFLYISVPGARMLGIDPDAVVGVSGFAWIHPDDVARAEEDFAHVLAAPGAEVQVQHRYRHEAGGWRWLELRAKNRLDDPDIGGVVVNFHDVTDARVAEETRRARERVLDEERLWFEAVLDALPVPIALAEPETLKMRFANTAANEIAGGAFPLAEAVDEYERFYACTDMTGRALSPADLVGGAGRGEPAVAQELVWDSPVGRRYLLLSTRLLPALYGRPPTILCCFPDIRRQKEIEVALGEALEARDAFLAAASHELRNPMNALHLNLQFLRRALARPETAAAGAPEVSKAIEQAARIGRLLDNLLDLSQLTRGEPHLELEEIDLAGIARETVDRFRAEPGACEIRVEAPDVLRLRSDALRVEQCVGNLLSNAIKYGEGAPVDVIVAEEPDAASVAVRDRGIGIAAEEQERVFDRFRRGVPHRNYGGFGLGLWITKELVTALGGTIELASRPGEGSTFRIRLPRQAIEGERRGA